MDIKTKVLVFLNDQMEKKRFAHIHTPMVRDLEKFVLDILEGEQLKKVTGKMVQKSEESQQDKELTEKEMQELEAQKRLGEDEDE